MKNSGSTKKVVGALVLGAAAGAAIGILFAPKKGSETRQDISDNAKKLSNDLKNKVQDQVDDLKNQVSKAEKFLRDNVSDVKNNAEDRFAIAKGNLENKIGNAVDSAKA